jgi:hypothetical protein
VGLLVEDEDGVATEDRGEDLIALTGMEDLRITGEDLLDRRRIGQDHPGAFVGDAQREHVAVAVLAAVEQAPGLA